MSLVRRPGPAERTGDLRSSDAGGPAPRVSALAPRLSLFGAALGDEAAPQNGDAPMRFRLNAAVAAAACFAAFPAQAEPELVVTATRTPAQARDLPARIDVIDVDAARARGAVTLDQALAAVPGLQAPRTGPIGQQTSVFSGGFESNHTLVLFDGVRLDDASTPEGVFDAGQDTLGDGQRIEVVQGPMSALYGSAALGGVVNVLARRGGEGALNSRLESGLGSFGTITGLAGVDGTLGALRYAVTAEGYSSDGYDIVPERIATYTGEKDGADIGTLTGAFDLALSEAFALDLLVRRREARVDYDPGFFGDIGENPEAVTRSESELWRLGAGWTPSQAFALRLSGGQLRTDRQVSDAGIPGDAYHGRRRFADLTGQWRARDWSVVAGASSETEEIDALSFGSAIVGEQDQWGVFAAANGPAGPLNISAALRHDDYEGFGGETTWRAGASYSITPNARIYAAYGTSFRAPSLYERFAPFFGAAGLRPESAETWEIGADAAFALFGRDNGLELGVLYRSSDIDDLIGFFGWSYANVDEAEIDYAEARVALRPASWLTARAAYANTDARDAATDARLQRRPEHAWSAELEAAHGPFIAALSWRQVGARMDTVYDNAGFWAGVGRVEAYELLGASASWAFSDAVQFTISADNLLDETYEPVNGFAGAPASVMFGVRLRQ